MAFHLFKYLEASVAIVLFHKQVHMQTYVVLFIHHIQVASLECKCKDGKLCLFFLNKNKIQIQARLVNCAGRK